MKVTDPIQLGRFNNFSYRILKPHYSISDKPSTLKTTRIHSSDLITSKPFFNSSPNKLPLARTRTSKSIQNTPKLVPKKPFFSLKPENSPKQSSEFYVEDYIIIQKLTPSKIPKPSADSLFSKLQRRKASTKTNTIQIQTSPFGPPPRLYPIFS